MAKHISIVVPLYNEEESLPELFQWINNVCTREKLNFEVVFIDDGSVDDSWKIVSDLRKTNPEKVKGVRFGRNYGKSAALNTGFRMVEGDVVITMDADLQDSPDEIPELYKMITKDGFDLVSGWKKERHDPLSKTIPTKLYNWATRKMSGIYLHDFNCGLKAYRKNTVESIEVYGDMHRYIPVIAKRNGFHKIGEKVVKHQARKYGNSKFGMERFVNGPLDLMTITFLSRFSRKPMHFFGTIGGLLFFIGFIAFLYIGGAKLYSLYYDLPAKNITEISWFYLALTSMMMGTMMFLSGFLGEMISRNSQSKNQYQVSERFE